MVQERKTEQVVISAPNIRTAVFNIKGTAPLVQNAFPNKAREMMMAKMEAGTVAKGKKSRAARDFADDAKNATHTSKDFAYGIPAGAFRAAMISACRLVGFKMTLAKLSVWIEADGLDVHEGTPLVKLDAGKPEVSTIHVRLPTGVADIRARPMWREWGATVRVKYDADQFSLTDVTNLFSRVGAQIGIGEGRPDSKSSCGMGWGTFELV